MLVETFLEHVGASDAHELGPALATAELERWRAAAEFELPGDLLAFLERVNGLRLFPDIDTPTGRVRLLPLTEIAYAPRVLHPGTQACDDEYPASALALTEDPDGAQHLVLDVATGEYWDVDPIGGFADAERVGATWEEALSWIAHRADLV